MEIENEFNQNPLNPQDVFTVERILHVENKLKTTTKDYTTELAKIHNTNIADPNIPLDDAIKVKQQGIKHIETINMLVNTINEMKSQIKSLQNTNMGIIKDVNRLKQQIDNDKQTNQVKQTPENQPNLNNDNNDEFTQQKTKNNRKSKKIEVTQVSPGKGEIDMSGVTPPISYAKVLINKTKPPKTKITEELQEKLEEQGALFNEPPENEKKKKKKMSSEQMNSLKNEIRKSSQIIGLSPISSQHIQNETNKIINEGNYNKQTQGHIIKTAAVKNAVHRFLKDELLMDQKSRNSLTINTIYPSKSDNTSIIYIQCDDQDDIAKITSNAPNLNHPSSHREEPKIVPHVPKILNPRYQALEKLAYQIRMTDPGKVQTNIRLAKTDYLLRVKNKTDKTPWKEVIPIQIPEHIPKPELTLLKSDNPTNTGIESNSENAPEDTQTTPPRENLWEHFLRFQPEGTTQEQITNEGTMTPLLKQTKHTMSHQNSLVEHKKKKYNQTLK